MKKRRHSLTRLKKLGKVEEAKNERFGRGIDSISFEKELEETQSPAQKAAFQKMLDKKKGKEDKE